MSYCFVLVDGHIWVGQMWQQLLGSLETWFSPEMHES